MPCSFVSVELYTQGQGASRHVDELLDLVMQATGQLVGARALKAGRRSALWLFISLPLIVR